MLPLPCMLVCRFCLRKIARETSGAASTRSSLRPLTGRAGSFQANLGQFMSRDRETISTRHCERSEAIHDPAQRKNGLLSFARNDVGRSEPAWGEGYTR